MASSKRRPDKQRRNQRNRAERAARAARSARAGEATAISRGEREPVRTASAEAPTKTSRSRRRKPSAFTIPGQRAVLLSFLFTMVSAATLLLAPVQAPRDVQPDDPRVEDESPELNDDGTVTVFEDVKLLEEEGVATGALIMLVPMAITGTAVVFTKRPQRSTAWTMAMIALSAFIFFGAGRYGIITLPSLVAIAIGGFQSRRADSKVRLAEIAAQRAARAAGDEDGQVIDAEVIDEGGSGDVAADESAQTADGEDLGDDGAR